MRTEDGEEGPFDTSLQGDQQRDGLVGRRGRVSTEGYIVRAALFYRVQVKAEVSEGYKGGANIERMSMADNKTCAARSKKRSLKKSDFRGSSGLLFRGGDGGWSSIGGGNWKELLGLITIAGKGICPVQGICGARHS